MVVGVSVIYSRDRVAAWELPSIIGEYYHTSLAQETIKIQNSQYGFYGMCMTFTQYGQKIGSRTIMSPVLSAWKDGVSFRLWISFENCLGERHILV